MISRLKPRLLPRRKTKRPNRERSPVTVCIAALAERTTLIGVSDRMLTAGDVEFEPAQAKMWRFSNGIWGLVAGDMGIQAEILKRVDKEIKNRIAAEPSVWVPVRDAALCYCKHYHELLRDQAESAILHPLGLDLSTFLEKQTVMQKELVLDIAERLSNYEFPSQLEMIFMGKDNEGPIANAGEKLVYAHLYVLDGDKLADLTTVGFAAIGIGKNHAESQLMFSGHWPMKAFDETILLAYAAKKRAEAAPGVGKATDIVVIGPALGIDFMIKEEHLGQLEKIYQKSRIASAKAVKKAQEETKSFIEKVKSEYKPPAEPSKIEVSITPKPEELNPSPSVKA